MPIHPLFLGTLEEGVGRHSLFAWCDRVDLARLWHCLNSSDPQRMLHRTEVEQFFCAARLWIHLIDPNRPHLCSVPPQESPLLCPFTVPAALYDCLVSEGSLSTGLIPMGLGATYTALPSIGRDADGQESGEKTSSVSSVLVPQHWEEVGGI